MALLVSKIFLDDAQFVKLLATESTKGKRENAILILERLQPEFIIYSTPAHLCALGGLLAIQWEHIAKISSRTSTDLQYHLAKQDKIKIFVKLESTLRLQEHLLLSCGNDFALSYTTDCYHHHPTNDFVRDLHTRILHRTTISPAWQHLFEEGRIETEYTLRLCVHTLKKHPNALKKCVQLMKEQCIRTHPHHARFFLNIWGRVQKTLGCQCISIKLQAFKQKQSLYAPKTLIVNEEAKLFHPKDFERILILVIMHNAWIDNKTQRSSAPSSVQQIWKCLGI